MAKKINLEVKTPPPDKPVYVKCIDCAGAELHRWRGDPLIARCRNDRNTPRQVANTKHRCNCFTPLQRGKEPEIINHDDG